MRWIFLALGFVFVALGGLGVVLPGLPTTPFVLLAAWMFSKSSPRFHAWLWNHRIFGPYVRNWAQHHVIPLKIKLLATSVMTLGVATLVYRTAPAYVVGLVAVVCLAGVAFIWRCPSHPHQEAPATTPS